MVLALLPQVAPDLLLLDWELPGLAQHSAPQGFMTTLRKQQPRLYIIALSFLCELEPFVLQAGVDGFVCKAATPDYLVQALQQARQKGGSFAKVQATTASVVKSRIQARSMTR